MPRRPKRHSITTDARDAQSLFYPSGATVCRQGEEGDALFIVRSGQVAISVREGESTKQLAVLSEGEFFGELSLLDGQPHSVTARTLQDSELLRVPRESFLATLADADVLRDVLLVLAGRLRGADKLLMAESYESLRSRAEARTDALTGLGNRRRLDEDLADLQPLVERYGHTYAIAMLDVDWFKAYNDAFGHTSGDRVLRAVARAIRQSCRTGDRAYRYGGEEFVVVMPEQDAASAAHGADRHRRAVERLHLPHGENQPYGVVTLSAGVAVMSRASQLSATAALSAADQALYQAKRLGRNRVEEAASAFTTS